MEIIGVIYFCILILSPEKVADPGADWESRFLISRAGPQSAPEKAIFENADMMLAYTMKSSVPTGVSLAIMVQEGAGYSTLYCKYNNLFGTKTAGKRPHVNIFDVVPSKFVVYQSRAESIRHHVQVLDLPRYKHLHGKTDNEWMNGVAEAGYAQAKDYSEKLKKIYGRYKLGRYSQLKAWYQSCNNRKGF